MYPDMELKEKVTHGTRQRPISALFFTAGPGTRYPKRFFVERHWHGYIEILLIKKGNYSVEINLEEYVLKAGDICMINSEELHQITGLEQETEHQVLLFDPHILDFSYQDVWQEKEIGPFLDHRMIVRNLLHPSDPGYGAIHGLLELILEAAGKQEGEDSRWYIRCKLLLLALFDQICREQLLLPADLAQSGTDMRKISRYKTIISYMEAHYQEPVSLQEMAEAIPCNSQYLCRFFKEIAGISPIQYLISYRIDRACELLVSTSRPILEIALDCGFENVSYFIRKFREVKSCTPREYRNHLSNRF